MDVTTVDNTTIKGEDCPGKEGILQVRHLRKNPWYKRPFVCKSILLLASFLWHAIEMVHNTEKSRYITLISHPQATLWKGNNSPLMPPQPQDNSDWGLKIDSVVELCVPIFKILALMLGESSGSGISFLFLCMHGSSGLLPWSNNLLGTNKLSGAGWSEN